MESRHSHVLSLGFTLVILAAFICSTQARPPRTFYVGGKDGWRLLPHDGLNRWAVGKRFRVNDTIVFDYEKGKDSVLVVRKRQYYHCNKTSPIHNLTDGYSRLKFTRNGPFYFISGHADYCLKGQKLFIVVMSPNHNTTPPSPSPTPSAWPPTLPPVHTPPAQTPPPTSDVPAPSPSSWPPSPSPTAQTPPPASTPPSAEIPPTPSVPVPSPSSWPPSPSPAAQTPAPASTPTPAQTPPPSNIPTPSPSSWPPSPTAAAHPVPSHSPWSPSPSPTAQIPSPAPSPDVTALPPSSSSGDGWITAPAPAPKNSGQRSVVISWGLTMAAGFFICLV